ncbi:MAG: tetratricopeptide repeat protein [Nostoc sp.]|uniref:tetratricopeptide repeat protein n=1 Tax=Nostoc sp. TaxID=1180 RepID=UPI002FFBBDF3
MDNLAELYLIQGRYLSAEQKALEAYSLRKQLFSSEQFDIVDSLKILAVIYTYQGPYLQAEKLYLEVFPILESSLGKEHPIIAD